MKEKILALIILGELLFILQLGLYLYDRFFGMSVSSMKQESLIFSQDAKLNHFYEPKANTTIEYKQSWLPYVAKSTINADSLNERFDYTIEKPNDTFRIITLGDSFTYGQYVNTKDNWPEQLENKLGTLRCSAVKKFEVVNLGVFGYDTAYAVERFRLRGKKYRPDLVLWYIHDNDFKDFNEAQYGAYRNQLRDARQAPSLLKRKTQEKSIRQDIIKKYGEENILIYQKAHLHKISDYLKDKLVLFSFSAMPKKYKDILRDFVKSDTNSIYFDKFLDLYKAGGTLPDGHPNKKGHILIADNLFLYLTKNKIIPCD